MKKIGIIGGIGPESTLDYYRGIIDAFRSSGGAVNYPEIIIYSANLTELLEIMERQDLAALTDWLVARTKALARAGADFAAMASNTPHVVFPAVARRSPLPLLSLIEAVCRKAQALGVKRPALLGTGFTMAADFYPQAFAAAGIPLVIPNKEEREYIHEKLFTEIELGIIKDSTRNTLLGIVETMIARDGIDSVILGCTELPLILDRDAFGLPFLNTTAIHVEAIVQYCRRNGG